MTEQEFETFIKQSQKTYGTPSRASFESVLSKLERNPVTEEVPTRYNTQTATSKIINNKLTDIIGIWKWKKAVLVPSFLILLFVGAFSLSSQGNKYANTPLLQLVEQDAQIEEPGLEDEDEILIEAFDSPGIDDLSTIENEI
jgi:hypothetical protein